MLALAGCGGSGGQPSDKIAAAARRTLDSSFDWRGSIGSGSAFGAPVRVKGAALAPPGAAYAALDLSRVPQGAVEYLTWRGSELLAAPAPGSTLPLPTGTSIVSVPLTRRVDEVFPHVVAQVEALDPGFVLAELATGVTAAKRTGSDVIAHVPLERYRVTIDLPRVRVATAPERLALADERAAARRVNATVWLDGPGHVARVAFTPPGAGFGPVELALSGYGSGFSATPLDRSVVAPLARLVTAFPAGASPLLRLGVSR